MNLLFVLNLIFAKETPAAIGIDLGTTFCCVSIFKENDKETSFLQFPNGEYTYPSVAYYNQMGDKGVYLTGWDAYTHNLANAVPGRYFYGYKRAMGLADVSELSKENEKEDKEKKFQNSVTYKVRKIQEDGKFKTVFVVEDENNNEISTTDPEKLSAAVLRDISTLINKFYTIKSLVITVPAYFTGFQIEATKRAALMAGLPEPNISKEPLAAAYAYQIKKNLSKDSDEEKILVFDLGGGTFDVSVVDMQGEAVIVEKHGGNNYLGGENVNDNLTRYFSEIILNEKKVDVTKDKTLELRLRRFVEEFKIKLCNQYTKENKTKYSEKFNFTGTDTINLSLTLEKFNSLNTKFYRDIEGIFTNNQHGMFRENDNGSDTPLEKSSITKILLVGGCTRIPYIKTLLKNLFPKAKLYDDINADTIVAEGACLLAANNANMLPDNMSVSVIDVVPVDVGVKVDNDFFQPVLLKDTYIPGSGTMEFTTSQDNQTKVRISIAQGFRSKFSDNHFLGSCELDVQPGQPRGVPRVSITIEMSTDGTIEVSAKDVVTNKATGITFDSSVARLDKKKVAELIEDAEKNKEADKELKERFELIRTLEEEIRVIQSRMGQPGVSEDDKINVEGIINGLQKWLDDNKGTASKLDLEDKLTRFRESIKAILDKKSEHVEDKKPVEEKTGGRDEL